MAKVVQQAMAKAVMGRVDQPQIHKTQSIANISTIASQIDTKSTTKTINKTTAKTTAKKSGWI